MGDKNATNITHEFNQTVDVISQIFVYSRVVTSSVGIFTNIFVVLTLWSSWKFWRHSTGLLLLTLACVEIIGNAASFVLFVQMICNPVFHVYNAIPSLYLYLNNGFKRLSWLMIIPISVNRYALICKPFTHSAVTSTKSTLIQIIILTVLTLSTSVFELFEHEMTHYQFEICTLVMNVFISAIVPLIISMVLTVLVVREFSCINATLKDSVSTGARFRHGEKNVTRGMIAVNVAFIALTLPGVLFYVICWLTKFDHCYSAYSMISTAGDINFSVNIFLYILYLPKFRSTLIGFFNLRFWRNRGNTENGSIAISSI